MLASWLGEVEDALQVEKAMKELILHITNYISVVEVILIILIMLK